MKRIVIYPNYDYNDSYKFQNGGNSHYHNDIDYCYCYDDYL